MDNSRDYAFLMIEYETPSLIKDLHNEIREDELYTEDGSDYYGIEKETHVTLVPCLDNDVDIEEIKGMLKPLNDYKLILTNVSVFENDKFDVLKCNAASDILKDTNNAILRKYPSHSEYKEFKPHVTIAYLKKGVGEKYKQDMLLPLVILKPKNFHFSFTDKQGNKQNLRFV